MVSGSGGALVDILGWAMLLSLGLIVRVLVLSRAGFILDVLRLYNTYCRRDKFHALQKFQDFILKSFALNTKYYRILFMSSKQKLKISWWSEIHLIALIKFNKKSNLRKMYGQNSLSTLRMIRLLYLEICFPIFRISRSPTEENKFHCHSNKTHYARIF